MEGEGILESVSGDRYEGGFIANRKEGFGIEQFSNGDSYKGEYHYNKFHGKGIISLI